MRLIDAEKLNFDRLLDSICQGQAEEIIDEAHTVDAVEVVRCKNCVHRGWEIECPIEDRMGDDFFCAWGEKEEDEYDS